ncbi:MAG: response regulator [Promethearchaeota archaeon]
MKTEHFTDGEEAINHLRKDHDYSLVILDINLPKVSGLEVYNLIKSLNADLPVLIMTGYTDMEISGLRDNDLGILPKPFSINELLLRLKHIKDINDKIKNGK